MYWKLLIGAAVVSLAALFAGPAYSMPEPMAKPEATPTTEATYVVPSATRELMPGEKIGSLFDLNRKQPYILQKLSPRSWWYERQFYSTVFFVGEKGVLLFDPMKGHAEFLRLAIKEVTELPVTAIVYSHYHADHIGDAGIFVQDASRAGMKIRIIASQATARKLAFLRSELPKPGETVKWPMGSFQFEDLTVDLWGFERGAHSDDGAVWTLEGEGVAHVPDLINPDQLPYLVFAGAQDFVYYESNLDQLQRLEWRHLSGGHGNVGSKEDLDFYRMYLGDLKSAVGKAMGEVTWGYGIDPDKVRSHMSFFPAWINGIAAKVADAMRPKYGSYYGFEAGIARNAETVAMSMYLYQ